MTVQSLRRRPTGRALLAGIEALVHSNVFISLAAASVAVSTTRLAGLALDPRPIFIVFGATLFVYSMNRLTDIEEDADNLPGRAAFTRRYGWIPLGVGVLSYLAAIGLVAYWGVPYVEFMALPLVLGGLYSLGRVKRVFLVKNLLVGVAWGTIPLGVAVFSGVYWTPEILFLSGFVGVMLTVAAMIFDLKDRTGDRRRGIATVPVRYGPKTTRHIAQAVTVLVAAAVLVAVGTGFVGGEFLVLLAFQAYVFAYSRVAPTDGGPLFYGFVVDGEHVFLAALVLAVVPA